MEPEIGHCFFKINIFKFQNTKNEENMSKSFKHF